jgi:hypothetical protein
MSRSVQSAAPGHEAHGECIGCGTSLPLSEPILVKFHRCYYCGQHRPLGSGRRDRTAPVVIAAAFGLIALWWTQFWS